MAGRRRRARDHRLRRRPHARERGRGGGGTARRSRRRRRRRARRRRRGLIVAAARRPRARRAGGSATTASAACARTREQAATRSRRRRRASSPSRQLQPRSAAPAGVARRLHRRLRRRVRAPVQLHVAAAHGRGRHDDDAARRHAQLEPVVDRGRTTPRRRARLRIEPRVERRRRRSPTARPHRARHRAADPGARRKLRESRSRAAHAPRRRRLRRARPAPLQTIPAAKRASVIAAARCAMRRHGEAGRADRASDVRRWALPHSFKRSDRLTCRTARRSTSATAARELLHPQLSRPDRAARVDGLRGAHGPARNWRNGASRARARAQFAARDRARLPLDQRPQAGSDPSSGSRIGSSRSATVVTPTDGCVIGDD